MYSCCAIDKHLLNQIIYDGEILSILFIDIQSYGNINFWEIAAHSVDHMFSLYFDCL